MTHVVLGTTALVTYWIAALAKKGSAPHKLAGKVYLLAMLGLLVPAIPLSVRAYLNFSQTFGAFLFYLVLITFTVLCFTSATRYLDTTTLPAGLETSHAGVMLRQRGMRPMPTSLLDSLRPVLASVLGRDVSVVERWWVVNAKEPREMVNLVAPARGDEPTLVIALAGLLGLSPGESNLSHIEDVIGPARFARLETGEPNVIYLAKPTSEELGVAEGGTILIGGIPLEVAGFVVFMGGWPVLV
jgi:hypothetical protein